VTQNRFRRIITRSVVLLAALAFLYFLFAPLIDWVRERAFPPQITCGVPYDLVPGSYQIEDSRPWDGGIVVLYSAQCAQSGQLPVLLEGAYLRTGRGLNTDEQYGGQSIGAPSAGQLLSYSQSRGDWVNQNGKNTGFSLINGRVYAPNVNTIEATFANGQVQRDTPGAAVFALIIQANVPACELRALDAEAKILLQIDLSATAEPEAAECQNVP
jgi:hypothetical protein